MLELRQNKTIKEKEWENTPKGIRFLGVIGK